MNRIEARNLALNKHSIYKYIKNRIFAASEEGKFELVLSNENNRFDCFSDDILYTVVYNTLVQVEGYTVDWDNANKFLKIKWWQTT